MRRRSAACIAHRPCCGRNCAVPGVELDAGTTTNPTVDSFPLKPRQQIDRPPPLEIGVGIRFDANPLGYS